MSKEGDSEFTTNGRVDLLHHKNLTSYKFFEEKTRYEDFADKSSQNILSETPLSNMFFSDTNLEALHEGIRYIVYSRTNPSQIIDRQSDTELRVIMRSIYLQYAKNQPDNLVEQTRALNERVLDFACNRVLTELEQFVNYRKDVSTLPVPMEPAKNVSQKGQRFLFLEKI